MEKRLSRPGVALLLLSEAIDMVLPWLWKLVRPDEPAECWLAEGLAGEATWSAGRAGRGLASEAPWSARIRRTSRGRMEARLADMVRRGRLLLCSGSIVPSRTRTGTGDKSRL